MENDQEVQEADILIEKSPCRELAPIGQVKIGANSQTNYRKGNIWHVIALSSE